MEQRRIGLSESAYTDLAGIEAYIAQDSPAVARTFINRIFEKIEQLYVHPESGRVVPEFNDKESQGAYIEEIPDRVSNSK
jgi:plasmid stabilization system protein ParE